MKNAMLITTAAITLIVASRSALAVPITVDNFSFETSYNASTWVGSGQIENVGDHFATVPDGVKNAVSSQLPAGL